MAGISYKASGSLENKYKYNGKEIQHGEFSDGSGLETYDYGHRMQDPQLGRFWQQDRMAVKFPWQSPYVYGSNDPIKNMDINGDSGWVQYKDANNVTQTVNNKAVNNQDDAAAAYGEGAKYIGVTGTMKSNQGGEQNWQLNADGSRTEIKPNATLSDVNDASGVVSLETTAAGVAADSKLNKAAILADEGGAEFMTKVEGTIKVVGVVTSVISAVKAVDDFQSGHTTQGYIHSLDAVMGLVGTFGGPVGGSIAVIYGVSRLFWGND